MKLKTAADSQSESQREYLRFEVQLTQPAADLIEVQLKTAADSRSESQSEHLRFEVQLTQPAADLIIEVQLNTAADSRSARPPAGQIGMQIVQFRLET